MSNLILKLQTTFTMKYEEETNLVLVLYVGCLFVDLLLEIYFAGW